MFSARYATGVGAGSDALGRYHRALPGAGEPAGRVRDAFHRAAVAAEHAGVVVGDSPTCDMERHCCRHLCGKGRSHGVCQSPTERSGGGLDARREDQLGVARRGHRSSIAAAMRINSGPNNG